jgi:hypothetical protein
MDLATRFRITATSKVVKITSLTTDFLHPIERAEKVQTRFGKAVLLTLQQQSPLSCVKVFLPRRYGALFTEADLTSINEKSVAFALRYCGTCPTSNSYILEIE